MSGVGKKVCFETFGCRLNHAEALAEEAKYVAAGWTVVTSHAEADVIVMRGCSVTQRAQRDCARLAAHIRRKYPKTRFIIQGCFKDERKAGEGRHLNDGAVLPPDVPESAIPVPTRTARAYLKVQDGCGGGCTFCIVPKFRGAARSVPFDAVLDRARRFIDAGYHEIVVTGCNLSLYADSGRHLCDLVAALAELDPTGCRIRLGSLEPCESAMDTVAAVAEHANVCRFLHLPVQSGSDKILRAMRRPYSSKSVVSVVKAARRLMPLVAIGCDMMTGFPGESPLDHYASLGLVKRLEFCNAHVFPYSERPGTVAVKYQGVIPKEIRRIRAHELTKIADAKRQLFAQRFVHKEVEVLIEDETHQAGWTSEYLWYEPPHILQHFARKDLARLPVHSSRHGKLH